MLPFLAQNQRDHLVLGRTGKYRFFPKFRVSARVRNFHTYVVGLTGRGKSKFLQNCLVQDILAGRGCAIIDPHGDLAKDVLRSLVSMGYFADKATLDRVMYVAPRRRDHVIPFNVLARPDPHTETYEVAQRVIAAFMRTWSRTLLEPPRFQQIMRASLAALVETGENLTSLYRLLTDDDFRSGQLQKIGDPKVAADCRAFFGNEFERWGRDRLGMMASTTNKVSALTDNPSLFYMLGQKDNRLNIRQIMDQGKVLLVDLGDCDDETKRLFGTLDRHRIRAGRAEPRPSAAGNPPAILPVHRRVPGLRGPTGRGCHLPADAVPGQEVRPAFNTGQPEHRPTERGASDRAGQRPDDGRLSNIQSRCRSHGARAGRGGHAGGEARAADRHPAPGLRAAV